MFSNYYHLGNTIELYNTQNKSLCSKWHFIGKHSKLFDPSLRCYEMILSTGNLSKMEIPENKKNAKIKTLSLFQGYIVFQLYLFTSKQLSIELAISDTTNAKRRLIFSSNNDNLVINQLHCRIPIFNFPIGRWVNLSIDILSFVSECFRNLTFRSVDYISLSMSGKVRYIFTMRTPLIDKNNMEDELIEEKFDELDDCGRGDVSGNSSVLYGAKDIPDKYKFPPHEEIININMNCNYVLSQFYIQNELKQLGYQQKLLLNSEPILVQDTADASNMDKGLKFRHDIYIQNKKKFRKNNKSYLEENFYENPFNNYNNISRSTNENINNQKPYSGKYNRERKIISNEASIFQNEPQIQNSNDQTGRFRNIGSLIISQGNKNQIGGGFSKVGNNNNNNNIGYGEREGDGDYMNYQNNNNRYGNYNSLKESGGKENKLFNKEEYNKLYNNGKGLTDQINQNLNLKVNNNNNGNDIDEHINYQLSTIKNENQNNSNNSNINNTNNNSECIEEDKKVLMGVILEDSLNFINQSKINAENADSNENKENVEEKRPFSPPITKIEDGEEQEISI